MTYSRFGGHSYRIVLNTGHDSHLASFTPRPGGLRLQDYNVLNSNPVPISKLEQWRDRLFEAAETGYILTPPSVCSLEKVLITMSLVNLYVDVQSTHIE